MRKIYFIFFLLPICFLKSQNNSTVIIPAQSMLSRLTIGDSLVYYQCHVEMGTQQLSTAAGQTLTGNPQKYSITEKYVLIKSAMGYFMKYYTSSLTLFPNRKFSGLKIREKPYWDFKHVSSLELNESALLKMLALEKKGREAMEYDYAITKYTTNQLIIKHKKDFKQLVIDGPEILSRLVLN